jgi:beta-lactam-binding protein with PASTA domain
LLVFTGIAAAYFITRDGTKTTRVPNVVGLSATAATQELSRRGLSPVVRESASSNAKVGTVISEAPGAGTKVDRGTQVTIVVARGPKVVTVPNVVGLSVAEAFVRLQAVGLKGRTVKIASKRPKDQVIRQAPPGNGKAKKGSTVLLTISKGTSAAVVPSVKGLTEAAATATLTRLGFKLSVSRIPSTEPKGIVVSQAPAPGTRAAKGSIVGIDVSTGPSTSTNSTTTTTTTTTTTPQPQPPAPGTATVPRVVGMGQLNAVMQIEQAKLRVDSYPVASSRPRGMVVAQRPAGGARAAMNSVVRIDVSLGPGERPLRTIPDVVGQTEIEARHALINAGFTVRSINQPTADATEKDVVLDQKPAGGDTAAAGTQILIYVGRLPSPSG